jgi:bifunctional DNA-binding transcriptional regulator/antitoxin component of YhaV-PrlF toxin-antitoxin module
MDVVVEMDAKGRIVIPSSLRRGLASKRIVLRRVNDHLELIPLPDPKSLKGKYRLEGRMEDIEELQEQKLSERV